VEWRPLKVRIFLSQPFSFIYLYLYLFHPVYLNHSLVATLRKQRPDLLENWKDVKAEPIPEQIPQDRLAPHIPKIEGLGQPVTASLFTLSSVNPTNW